MFSRILPSKGGTFLKSHNSNWQKEETESKDQAIYKLTPLEKTFQTIQSQDRNLIEVLNSKLIFSDQLIYDWEFKIIMKKEYNLSESEINELLEHFHNFDDENESKLFVTRKGIEKGMINLKQTLGGSNALQEGEIIGRRNTKVSTLLKNAPAEKLQIRLTFDKERILKDYEDKLKLGLSPTSQRAKSQAATTQSVMRNKRMDDPFMSQFSSVAFQEDLQKIGIQREEKFSDYYKPMSSRTTFTKETQIREKYKKEVIYNSRNKDIDFQTPNSKNSEEMEKKDNFEQMKINEKPTFNFERQLAELKHLEQEIKSKRNDKLIKTQFKRPDFYIEPVEHKIIKPQKDSQFRIQKPKTERTTFFSQTSNLREHPKRTKSTFNKPNNFDDKLKILNYSPLFSKQSFKNGTNQIESSNRNVKTGIFKTYDQAFPSTSEMPQFSKPRVKEIKISHHTPSITYKPLSQNPTLRNPSGFRVQPKASIFNNIRNTPENTGSPMKHYVNYETVKENARLSSLFGTTGFSFRLFPQSTRSRTGDLPTKSRTMIPTTPLYEQEPPKYTPNRVEGYQTARYEMEERIPDSVPPFSERPLTASIIGYSKSPFHKSSKITDFYRTLNM